MDKEVMQKLNEVKDYIRNVEYINSAISVLYWDMRVGIPSKGVEYRGEVLGYLSTEAYKLITSDKVAEYIEYFKDKSDLDDVTSSMLKNMKKEYDKTKKIPQDRYREYVVLQSQSEAKWEEAKEKSDFSIFYPYLEKVVGFTKEFIGYWGYEKNKYDTLLDFYEPGITVEKLDVVFSELRDAIVTLLRKIQKKGAKANTNILKGDFSKESQEKLGLYVLEKMGYDLEAGRLDESVHPFTINFANTDVRVTTNYHEHDFTSSFYSCVHEGGHAIYEQGIPNELRGTGLATGTSMGIHESQSRFYENILGRSREFLSYFYPEVARTYNQFQRVDFEDFYKAVNHTEPSLIRVEADELTYSLHIIIRYEIEKMLFNNEIEAADLPKVWNEKYKEYLGVEPQNDAEGVLQDMHWSGGSFGYFPSYALGNLYGAQFFNKMERDIPDLKSKVRSGDFGVIREWLNKNIHKYGAVYKPADLIKRVTGEELNAKYFIEYLNKKYTEVYELD